MGHLASSMPMTQGSFPIRLTAVVDMHSRNRYAELLLLSRLSSCLLCHQSDFLSDFVLFIFRLLFFLVFILCLLIFEQPMVCRYNLMRLGEVLSHIVPAEKIKAELEAYTKLFEDAYLGKMRAKVQTRVASRSKADLAQLGLHEIDDDDGVLVKELLAALETTAADYTNTMRMASPHT